MKKLLVLLLTLVLAISMVGCSEKPQQEEKFMVGLCQIAAHPALDKASKGFMDALTDKLGDKVEFDYQNAAGEPTTVATIINGFVSNNYDLILANATDCLQAAAGATNKIPVLGTSITEYGTALSIENFDGVVGGNVSGTSDLAPLDLQAQMIIDILNPKTVGLIYCSSEDNSKYQVKVVEAYLNERNVETKRFTFTDSKDIADVVAQACSECDALYVPTDNMAAAYTETIDGVALKAGVPIIAGEEGICSGCGVATLSIDYYDLGYATGEMAALILTGAADISTMPIQYTPADKLTYKYDAARCAALNITIPEGYVAIEK